MGVLERLGIFLKPVDYKKSLREAYHELFVGLLRREPALIALLVDIDGIEATRRGAEMERELEGAPSRVPNWSQRRKKHWVDYDEAIYQRIQLGTSPSLPAPAFAPVLGSQSPDWRLCWVDQKQNDRTFMVQAVILCRITYVSSPIGSSEFRSLPPQEHFPSSSRHHHHLLRTSLTTIDAWLSAIKLYAPSTPPYHFNPTAIFKTLYAFEWQPPKPKNGQGRGIVNGHFQVWNEILNGSQSEYMYTPDHQQQLIDEVLQTPEARHFTYNVCERFAGETMLFLSQADGFVGKGPKGMRRGDVVALIRGLGSR